MTDPEKYRPVKPVFVLDNGIRVPLDLRYRGVRDTSIGSGSLSHVYEPVIEGDLVKLLPRVVAIDAETWPSGSAFLFPSLGAAGKEWAERVLSNSPVFKTGSGATGFGWKASK